MGERQLTSVDAAQREYIARLERWQQARRANLREIEALIERRQLEIDNLIAQLKATE